MSDSCRAQHFLARCLRVAQSDVVEDRLGEEKRILRNDAQMLPILADAEVGERSAIDENLAFGRPVKRGDERDERALAGSRRTDEGQ